MGPDGCYAQVKIYTSVYVQTALGIVGCCCSSFALDRNHADTFRSCRTVLFGNDPKYECTRVAVAGARYVHHVRVVLLVIHSVCLFHSKTWRVCHAELGDVPSEHCFLALACLLHTNHAPPPLWLLSVLSLPSPLQHAVPPG